MLPAEGLASPVLLQGAAAPPELPPPSYLCCWWDMEGQDFTALLPIQDAVEAVERSCP